MSTPTRLPFQSIIADHLDLHLEVDAVPLADGLGRGVDEGFHLVDGGRAADAGLDEGGGVGGGPGISVGAALALKGSGRLPVAVCGDGDFMMGVTALWTAAHYRIPLLIVVANNRSFFNDELHQERVARVRNRPIENRWVGQRISEPDIDLAGIARAQGALGFGPVTAIGDLDATFAKAIAAVEAGAVAVVDVRVEPGYTAATTAAMTRKSD